MDVCAHIVVPCMPLSFKDIVVIVIGEAYIHLVYVVALIDDVLNEVVFTDLYATVGAICFSR